jgi:predicted ATPase
VEDAQYADAGLLDFLDHLIDWVRDLPVFVLVFARPELGQARPGFGTGRNRSTLTLDPLDPASMDQLVDALVPGMPTAAQAKITRQAQGIPLFAVETVRSLIDRDIIQPIEGVYRLTGDIGELAVPDSLHALLAARLDALDPDVRRLVADAAVLGTTFPAEALIAVSGQDETAVRAALAELVRREVLTISAEPLSPERGSYGFAQNMLRQVAYDTLSRRDRKTRHLTVAAHLRAAFPNDGEEVADVIARHYLDALNAVPDDPDSAEIRGQATGMLIRAAERAKRTGAPAMAAASFAAAAELISVDSADKRLAVGSLWERAAEASATEGDWAAAVEYARRAREYYAQHGQGRAAARAQAIAGRALRLWGRLAEAREQLTAAMEMLREDPDIDTLHALSQLAALEAFTGSPDADRLTTEVVALCQALDVSIAQVCEPFVIRGIYLIHAGRRLEAIAYLRESARLAAQTGDNVALGRALLNLSSALEFTDFAAAVEAARTATEHLRRAGARDYLAFAVGNLISSLMYFGDWDAAEAELTQAMDSGGLGDIEFLACQRGLLAGLRGDADTAGAMLAALPNLRASEDPQDMAFIGCVEAFAAAARGEQDVALRHARDAFAHAGSLWINQEDTLWAWPLAARIAYELPDATATLELLTMLESHPTGHVLPMLRAERDLARARLADRDGDHSVGAAFAAAITRVREQSAPYHLAQALLDHAQYHARHGDGDGAARAIEEARAIGHRLRCRPLLDRADAIEGAASQIRVSR